MDWRGFHQVAEGLLSQWEPGRVLDMPTWKGVLAARMAELGYRPICGDIDPRPFEAEAPLVQLDLNRTLPFADDSFDYVTFLDGVEHLNRPFDAVGEIARVLKPGGRLIISTPNILSLRSRWRFLWSGYHLRFRNNISDSEGYGSGGHIIPLSYREIDYFLIRHGMKVQQVLTDIHRRKAWPLHILLRFLTGLAAGKNPYAEVYRGDTITSGRTLIMVAERTAGEG